MAFTTVDKRALIEVLCGELRAEIAVGITAAKIAREAATHEESKPENDKDTRGLEAAYLAGAQASRVGELERTVTTLKQLPLRAFADSDAIAISALVAVECDQTRSIYFISPTGGGMQARVGQTEVKVVTPVSPLGQALLGKGVGDEVEVQARQGLRVYAITGLW
ncbi:MAG: hypothetical protein NVS3B20_20880 [Polyangiales bacterium]